jgi:hypothetical protein
MHVSIQWAVKRIMDIVNPKFFGTITLRFQNGVLVRLEHDHSEVPPQKN